MIESVLKSKYCGRAKAAKFILMIFCVSCIGLLSLVAAPANARPAEISKNRASFVLNGIVTDEKNETLPGATVRIKGTDRGATTDVNGKFILEVNNPSDSLVVTFVGYKTQTLLIGDRKTITIKLLPDEDSQKLNEVVVVGYGTQKKASVTGAISQVSMKDMQRISTPSLTNALGGSMPGIVTRQSSGEPGYDGAVVLIRGMGTYGNASPLVLVDGVPREMNNLNTQEIESISMLKDASATAVYGVRGANGVILITTKRGALAKPVVTLRTENAILSALRLPEYINGPQYAGLVNESRANEGLSPIFNEEELQKYNDGSDPYLYPNVDWVNTILKKNTSQTINNLSVTGGTEMVKYYTNVGYTVQNGIYKQASDNFWDNNAQMRRYNFRSNVDVSVSKTVTLGLGIGGIIQKGNYPGAAAPRIFDAIKITSPINFPVTNPDGSIAGGQTSYLQENPYGLVSRSGYSTQDRNSLQGTFTAKWDLGTLVTKGLSLRGLFSYDHNYTGWNDRFKAYAIRQYLGKDANGEDTYRNPNIREESPMGYGYGSTTQRSYYTEASVNYTRGFGKHTITGLALINQRDYKDLSAGTSILNLPFRMRGFAGRITYDYNNRYLLETNVGYNGSEQFPEGKRYGFFPSGSAGWVISNESFWHVDAISNLKIRGSIGKVGNDNVAAGTRRFLFLTKLVQGGQSYFFGDGQRFYSGINEDQIGYEDVTWETAVKTNIGIDLEMFKGKVVFQLDMFKERRTGILTQRRQVPRVAGYYPWVLPYANLGIVKNKGFDAMLELKNTTSRGLFYSFRGNVTYSKNEVVYDDSPVYLYPYQNTFGNPIGQPYGLISLGYFKDADDIASSPRQTFMTDVRPGDIKYQDVNGDGVIDVYDRVPIGYSRMPQVVYGATFSAAYKGFEAAVFFTGATQASIFVDGPSMYPFQMGLATYNVLDEYYNNRWTPSTPNAKYPRASTGDNLNNNRTSTHFLRDASFLRLKSAEVAYNFEVKALKKVGVQRIRLFVNGMNLYTWDKLKIIDPESDYGTGGYPLQRTLNLGGQFTF